MHDIESIQRGAIRDASDLLKEFPAVAIIGPRQCGKSTLARQILKGISGGVLLDLEDPEDRAKVADPSLFFSRHEADLVCLDEIQFRPELFPFLRTRLDRVGRPGQILILGSASPALLRQGSESLAGRIAFLELTPFTFAEVSAHGMKEVEKMWWRGGFPRSFLSANDRSSRRWRREFLKTFLERDLANFGKTIPAETLRRFLQFLTHYHGQQWNSSEIGKCLGVSHVTTKSWLDLFVGLFLIRSLSPFLPNLKKRLVRSPKIYWRDVGLLQAMAGIDSFDDLLGHPLLGPSWEGLVIEQLIQAHPGWEPYYYRTAKGAEIDLILTRGGKIKAFECKASTTPTLTPGFFNAMRDLGIEEATIVAPVKESYPIAPGVEVVGLGFISKNK